ncbi:MAG: diaminopimelate decarboxylase, partial [bacterium]|nr:diaminopimelate decarboxylase [bacterium]
YFHGNNKSAEEITMALEAEVGCVVVDNRHEFELLRHLNSSRRPAGVLLRVALGVDAVTHKYIQTGQHDSKFGFAIGGEDLEYVVAELLNGGNLQLNGFHSHIGSQISTLANFHDAVVAMFAVVDTFRTKHGWTPIELNFGGGLGINYLSTDDIAGIADFVNTVLSAAQEQANIRGIAPRFVIEPGRSIIGQAGTTLYSVGSIKRIPGVRNFLAINGGMTDNPRPALYQAKYECLVANKALEIAHDTYSIAGRCCESGDMLIWDYQLPAVETGDILAVMATGAYNYSMASNYNRIPKPAIILVKDGCARLMVERETYADMVRMDKKLGTTN